MQKIKVARAKRRWRKGEVSENGRGGETKKDKEGDKMQLMQEENVHPSLTTEPKWNVKSS